MVGIACPREMTGTRAADETLAPGPTARRRRREVDHGAVDAGRLTRSREWRRIGLRHGLRVVGRQRIGQVRRVGAGRKDLHRAPLVCLPRCSPPDGPETAAIGGGTFIHQVGPDQVGFLRFAARELLGARAAV